MSEQKRTITQDEHREFSIEDYTVALNGVDLHYRTMGDGPPLFLISPGWGVGSEYLQRGFRSLAEHLRLIFIDTRGSGLSSRPADASAMGSADMADDLEALRIHLRLPKVNVLGHSNSGAIGLSYAERYPSRVDKLVVIDSQVLGLNATAETLKILESRAKDPRYEEAVRVVSPYLAGEINPGESDQTLTAFVAQILPLYLHQPEKTLARAKYELAGTISSYACRSQSAADAAYRTDQTQFLDQITAKVLIIVGRHDWICPVSLSERVHEGIPQSHLVIFEESGHMPWMEEPEKFFAELKNFLFS
jgi:proline iminopeptidase